MCIPFVSAVEYYVHTVYRYSIPVVENYISVMSFILSIIDHFHFGLLIRSSIFSHLYIDLGHVSQYWILVPLSRGGAGFQPHSTTLS